MTKKKFYLKQIIVDFIKCNIEEYLMSSPDFLLNIIKNAVNHIKSRIIKYTDYLFFPHGYTLLMILADSSITLHTWPEKRFITIEIFTCTKKSRPQAGIRILKKYLKPEKVNIRKVIRCN